MYDNSPMHASCHQNTPGTSPFANFFCPSHYRIQQLPITDAEKFVYPRPQTNLPVPCPAPSYPFESPITAPVPALTKDWYCQFCSDSFHRWQDRDRHEHTHLPYFFHCPLPHCEWRGNRIHTFKTHWKQKDHRPYYGIYGNLPKRSQIETYDPRQILDKLSSGEITLSEAEDQAIFCVQVRAYELQKPSMWMDPQGRSKKQALRNKEWARVL